MFIVQLGSGMGVNGKTCLYRKKRVVPSITIMWKALIMKPASKCKSRKALISLLKSVILQYVKKHN